MGTMNILNEVNGQETGYERLDERSSLPAINILEEPKIRKRTDFYFLIVFGVCIVVFLPFLIYTLCNSDINRFKGYDRCGNICGQENVKYDGLDCSGQDMTLKPKYDYGECKEEETYWQVSIFSNLGLLAWKAILVSSIPLALSLILVVLFRYVPAVAVWSILILSWMIFPILGVVLLLLLDFVLGIIFLIMAILTLFVLIFNVDKIRLITIQLREATKAIFNVKMLFSVPIGTLPISLAAYTVYVIIAFHIATAKEVTIIGNGYLVYFTNGYMMATIIITPMIMIWIVHFIFGIKDAVVSGAIAKWYSTRNHGDANDTVLTTLLVTVNYHLGTIALASLLYVIMAIPRAVLKCLAQLTVMNEMIDCCMRYIDGFFTNSIYIMTAAHGTSFIQSGKRAVRLLKRSTGNSIKINSFGDFVITMGQILVVGVSTLAGFATFSYIHASFADASPYSLLIEAGIAYIFSHVTLGTLKVASNTIFFCITEESSNNKEVDYPYTMSMKEFVEGSNKIFMSKVQNRPLSEVSRQRVCMKVFLVIFVCGLSCFLFFVGCFI